MSTLEDLYADVCNTVSEIYKHCPTLCDLASKCEHVTELGMNTMASTVALLAPQPKKLISYGGQLDKIERVRQVLEPIKGETELHLKHGDSLRISIEVTDMLFIDTFHTYTRLKKELNRHAGKVKKYIVFHDTTAFASRGEDGSCPGITQAILEFLQKHTNWRIILDVRNNNGLIALEKDHPDGPQFNTTYTMVTFDIPEVRWVERHVIGMSHPYKDLLEPEIDKQMYMLNRALRYGIIIAVERNFTTLKIGEGEVDTWYVVYHVGFKHRPPGK